MDVRSFQFSFCRQSQPSEVESPQVNQNHHEAFAGTTFYQSCIIRMVRWVKGCRRVSPLVTLDLSCRSLQRRVSFGHACCPLFPLLWTLPCLQKAVAVELRERMGEPAVVVEAHMKGVETCKPRYSFSLH